MNDTLYSYDQVREAQRRAEEEQIRAEEAQRMAEEARRRAEEARGTQRSTESEAQRKAEEEQIRAEEARRRAEEAQNRAEEAQKRAEGEVRRKAIDGVDSNNEALRNIDKHIENSVSNQPNVNRDIGVLQSYENSVISGDINFNDISSDYCNAVQDAFNIADGYVASATSTLEEVTQLIAHDEEVMAQAQEIYDDYMAATAPHYKTEISIVNGKEISSKISTYAEDAAAAAAKKEEYWIANRSWVWG